MTNATHWKYVNLYTFNRHRNEIFDNWLRANYVVHESTAVWSYGDETFEDILTGEKIYSEAIIMQIYVKKNRCRYFRDFCHYDKWLDSDCATQEEFFAINPH